MNKHPTAAGSWISSEADNEEAPVLRNKRPENDRRPSPYRHSRSSSYISEEGTLRGSHNGGVLASFSGTDSVRSATIRRGGNGGRPRSSIQIFEQGPIPGVSSPEVVPIAMPTPPISRSKDKVVNGSISSRKDNRNENGRYKLQLVAQLSKQLESGPVALEPKHRFQYNATSDFSKKGEHPILYYYIFP